jgi:hypothetical protein
MTTTAVQYRRGTTTEHATFTGLDGEFTIDTTKHTAVVHDGTTTGGFPLQKEISGFQNLVYTTGTYTDPSWITSLDYGKLSGTAPIWNQNTTGTAVNVTGTIAVANGGTGVSTFTAGLLKAEGTNNFITVSAPVGALVGTTDIQTLTNKTITAIAAYETKIAMAANAIDLSLGNCFSKTISATTTLTISNTPAANTAVVIILDLTNGGAFTLTWWSGVKWIGATVPTLTAAGRDMLGFITHDGGVTWSGIVLAKDIK